MEMGFEPGFPTLSTISSDVSVKRANAEDLPEDFCHFTTVNIEPFTVRVG